jgi:hypothetical protein
MTDGVMCNIMERNDTPSLLLNWLRSRCVPIGVKRLKVLTTCCEFWVSGKPSNQLGRGVDIPPTTRLASSSYLSSTCGNTCCKGNQEYGFCSRATDICPALWKCVWSCNRLWWTCPRVGMKGKRLLQNHRWMFQACELGLPCKVEFDSESSASHED